MNFSPYQLAIFDFVATQSGNAIVSACAGSGKTFSLVESLKYVAPDKKICLLAFNKAIAEELRKRVPPSVNVQTFHGLGWSVVNRNIRGAKLNNDKVYGHIQTYLEKHRIVFKDWTARIKFSNNLRKVIDFLRLNLIFVPTDSDIIKIGIEQDFSFEIAELNVVKKIYSAVLKDSSCYDFVDMLFVPLYKGMSFPKFDFIAIDECQDLSLIQHKLFQSCMSKNARFIAFGDEHQCFPSGTKISTPDGVKNIEDVRAGDDVISCYAKGLFYKSKVIGQFSREIDEDIYEIITSDGSKISATRNHIFLANFHRKLSNNGGYFVYLMYRVDKGYRIGKSNFTPKNLDRFDMHHRAMSEGADKMWILGRFEKEEDALLQESLLSLKYGIPKNVFVPRNNKCKIEKYIVSKIFNEASIFWCVEKLFKDFDLDFNYSHFYPKTTGSETKIINIKFTIKNINNIDLLSYYEKSKTNHCVFELSFHFSDKKMAQKLTDNGINVSSDHDFFRLRKDSRDIRDCIKYSDLIRGILSEFNIETVFSWDLFKHGVCKLREYPACMLREGMVMVNGNGESVSISSINKRRYSGFVHDLSVDKVANFVANNIVVHNCIYSFATSNANSYQLIKDYPNTTELPLSISYRCGKNIIKYAQELVSQIEAFSERGDGSVVHNGSINNIKDGDVILCRTNAPIVSLACKLLKDGRKAKIKGADFGKNLTNLIKESRATDVAGLIRALNKNLDKLEERIKEENPLIDPQSDAEYQRSYDKTQCIKALCENCSTFPELNKRIESIFSDSNGLEGITLSTIHKFKGLEAKNIFIIEPQLIPFPYYLHLPGQKEVERNLDYVARTRAIEKLEYIKDWSSIKKIEKVESGSKYAPPQKLTKKERRAKKLDAAKRKQ